jgi:2-polyprenyl-3-methyl-5-hydroxy-6-metoxy-1,4-benzoquinol methylase
MENYKNYIYPDYNDKITVKMIEEKEARECVGCWQKDEERIMHLMKSQIKEYVKKENPWFLDAGCGDGRLLPEFEKYFNNILFIDPDKNRILAAKKFVSRLNLTDKVTCKTLSIESIDSEQKFDVILCNHVLQHVNTGNILKILEKMYEVLNENGLLFITTCNSTKNKDYFIKQYIKNSKIIEEKITEEEFNTLVYNKKKLPIHFFDKEKLITLLKNLNFKVIYFEKFHNDRDMFISLTKNI